MSTADSRLVSALHFANGVQTPPVSVETSENTEHVRHGVTHDIRSYLSSTIVLIAFVFYAVRLFRLVSRYAVNIFFSDQWDFNDATLFQHHSLWQIFTWEHGPHREGVGGLVMKLVEPLFRWNSRTEAFFIGSIVCVSALLALWLKKRLFGPITVFDVVVAMIYFTPRQYESIFVSANIGRDCMPALLFLAYCLAWTLETGLTRYAAILVLDFLTTYTGFGIFAGIITPVLLVLDYRARGEDSSRARAYAVGAFVLSLLSFASFFIGYKDQPAMDCFSWKLLSPKVYLRFVAVMFSNFFAVPGTGRLARIIGMLVVLVLLAVLIISAVKLISRTVLQRSGGNYKRPLVITALVSFSVLFAMDAAYGRACAGLIGGLSSRYVMYLEPAVLGLYFYLLSLRPSRTRVLALVAIVVAALPASLYLDKDWFYYPEQKARWRTCYLQNENIEKCDQIVGFRVYPWPAVTHMREKMEFLKETHQNLYADSE